MFSMWSVLRCYKKGRRLDQVYFCTGGCEEDSSLQEYQLRVLWRENVMCDIWTV
jgi:hypothetical protein